LTKILVVDDSATTRHVVSQLLRAMKLEPIEAGSGERAVELYVQERPSMVLLDVNMPGIDGYETARRIRAAAPEEWAPIIFLSANEADQDFQRAIECGGDDYLIKPFSKVVLSAKIRALNRLDDMRRKLVELSNELAASNRRLEQISQQDGLTGVANRRYFDAFLAHHVALTARQRSNLAVALCDADSFKAYNDHYGHLAGDECLRKIATVLAKCCRRTTDLIARYGGEEFALVLPDTPIDGAVRLVETAREALGFMAIEHARSEVADRVTISVGITAFVHGRDTKPDDLIARADEALYRAKHTGRDRYIVL
jgi:diguanylate cyclase (GGDEF)-like protein